MYEHKMGIGTDFDGIADDFDGQKGSEMHDAGGQCWGIFIAQALGGLDLSQGIHLKIRSLVLVEKPKCVTSSIYPVYRLYILYFFFRLGIARKNGSLTR